MSVIGISGRYTSGIDYKGSNLMEPEERRCNQMNKNISAGVPFKSKYIIVEIAQFKLAAGVDEQGFLKESEAVQRDFLEKQKGYMDRELLKGEDGQWIDIVHWRSMEEAKRAADAIMQDPVCLGFLQKIDPKSVKMMHLWQVRTWSKK